jgi:plasmid stability protein
MPDVLVRDVDVSVLDKIKLRAKRQNRSLQSEMKIIFREAAEKREPLLELELIRKIRASNTKVNKTDSADLLREDRER